MSRFNAIKPEEATGAAAELFGKIKKAAGKVPNAYATIGTYSRAVRAEVAPVDRARAGRGVLRRRAEPRRRAGKQQPVEAGCRSGQAGCQRSGGL